MDPSIHFDNSCALDSVLFLDSAIYFLKNWTLEDNVLFDVYEIPKFINNSWKKKQRIYYREGGLDMWS